MSLPSSFRTPTPSSVPLVLRSSHVPSPPHSNHLSTASCPVPFPKAGFQLCSLFPTPPVARCSPLFRSPVPLRSASQVSIPKSPTPASCSASRPPVNPVLLYFQSRLPNPWILILNPYPPPQPTSCEPARRSRAEPSAPVQASLPAASREEAVAAAGQAR